MVVNLSEFKNREVVAVCRELLRMAEEGEATALAFVVKTGPRTHQAGMIGDYVRSPAEAMSAVFKMERHLSQDREPFSRSG